MSKKQTVNRKMAVKTNSSGQFRVNYNQLIHIASTLDNQVGELLLDELTIVRVKDYKGNISEVLLGDCIVFPNFAKQN